MKKLSPEERRALFDQFLRCLDREENLIHYRLMWGLQWNAAAIAGIFAVTQIEFGTKTLQIFLEVLICILSVAANYLSMSGINAAHNQSKFLINSINNRLETFNDRQWEESEFIRPYGQIDSVHRPARMVSITFPYIFLLGWIITTCVTMTVFAIHIAKIAV